MDKDSKYKKLFSKNLNYYMTLKNKTQTDIINDLDNKAFVITTDANDVHGEGFSFGFKV